ncbi:MAG TPA: site-specific integrase [Propylenella sp.]|nr:site-specific integrase [Propylenella sp.]
MRARLKHLPESEWPAGDRELFDAAYRPGDIFDDDAGAGAHLAERSRRCIHYAWRRWLGFLVEGYPDDLGLPAAGRITPERVRAYVEHLATTMRPSSVATTVGHLYDGARLIAPAKDWSWLRALKSRLQSRAETEDRFERLQAPARTLDFAHDLMDEALAMSASRQKHREVQYRDGLLLAVLTYWLIRRRSLAALTIRHVIMDEERAELRLRPEDTKSGRPENWPVPESLVPYLRRYLSEIRPALLGGRDYDAFWPSMKGGGLSEGQIYQIVRRRTAEKFGTPMSPHDFRRAAATYLAMHAPEKVGLTPGILQHATTDTGDRHYNLARTVQASRRHVGAISEVRARLRAAS